jgi:hypothetical protein
MFSKFFFVSAVVLAMGLQVNAQAGFTPALGVMSEDITQRDIKRPSNRHPCGKNVDVAAKIDKSTPAIAAADGTINLTVTGFG